MPAFAKAARCRSSLSYSFSAVRLGPYNNWIQAVYHNYPFAPPEPIWVDRFVARRLFPQPSVRGKTIDSMGVLIAYLSEDCLGSFVLFLFSFHPSC